MSSPSTLPKKRTGLVLVASTRAASGVYEDQSGPLAVTWLRKQGFETPDPLVLADADIPAYFDQLVAGGNLPTVILTSGGTGLSSDDRTVEAVRPHLTKEIPGIMQAFWNQGLQSKPTALLSCGVAGLIGSSFIMTLPGSTGAVKDGCTVLEPLLTHICQQLEDCHDH
ncbi:MAG: MogA/MoaB family molybdenum cofactor biosynthesis protein [Rothia sp. (in: high G+C Gram-positive bacteria)]|nr:MogA/MoaB family molybdenum cofactor biosynthesis protein [Rothia sp. (in: high G+C Gram-positive bacteria)]